jgi:hypothetical protein
MVKCSVFFEVRTKFLNIVQMYFVLQRASEHLFGISLSKCYGILISCLLTYKININIKMLVGPD